MNLNDVTVSAVTSTYFVPSPKGRHGNITDRPTYGLSFCAEGSITYTHRGKSYVSCRDNVIILPQGESYTLSADESGTFCVVNFTAVQPLTDTPMLISIDDPKPYISDFYAMRRLQPPEQNRTGLIGILYGMLHRMLSPGVPALLLPAVRYIEENYGDPALSNSALATACNISEVHFRKSFLRFMGVTPRQHIIGYRIGRAKELLCDGKLKLSSIAEQCGFSNPYHFCRCFKDKVGMTPTEYMLKNAEQKI